MAQNIHQERNTALSTVLGWYTVVVVNICWSIVAHRYIYAKLTYTVLHFIRYDADGHPEVHPFSNLDVALKWKPGCDDLCVPSIPLTPLVKSPVDPSLPRLLVCHDMMGGYQKDRFVQGHRCVFVLKHISKIISLLPFLYCICCLCK